MKKVNVLMATGVLILGLTNTVYSQEPKEVGPVIKIGIIDGKRIFDEHPDSKKATALLKKELEEKQKEIDARSEEIRKLEKELNSNLLLSDDERAKKETEINEKKRAVVKYSQEAEEYLSHKEEELTKEITQKVYLFIEEIAKEKGINLIIENNYVLYADDNLDITEDVIEKMKKASLPKTEKPKK